MTATLQLLTTKILYFSRGKSEVSLIWTHWNFNQDVGLAVSPVWNSLLYSFISDCRDVIINDLHSFVANGGQHH